MIAPSWNILPEKPIRFGHPFYAPMLATHTAR